MAWRVRLIEKVVGIWIWIWIWLLKTDVYVEKKWVTGKDKLKVMF